MITSLGAFNNSDFGEIRVLTRNNEPWFWAKEISEILGYKETNDMTRWIDEDDKFTTKEFDPEQLGVSNKIRMMTFVNESGLYEAIFHSKKNEAKKFKKWVTGEVLPSIRKHGMYAQDELLDNPDLLIAAATKLKEERAARLEAEKQRDKLLHQNKLYTTSEIAKELGLSSATKLNNLLSEKKIQYKQNGTWLLYSKYSDMDLVSIKQQILDNGKIIYDRKWTGKGRDFILNKFEGEIYK